MTYLHNIFDVSMKQQSRLESILALLRIVAWLGVAMVEIPYIPKCTEDRFVIFEGCKTRTFKPNFLSG